MDELIDKRDSIFSELPDEKVNEFRRLIDKIYDCMKEKNKLQKELFGLDEKYHLKMSIGKFFILKHLNAGEIVMNSKQVIPLSLPTPTPLPMRPHLNLRWILDAML